MPRTSLSLAEARRVALAAQGFGRPRPAAQINAGHIKKVIHNLGLLQLDFVNVLVPAHYLVLFSRLGKYEPERLRKTAYGTGEFIEQWAHEASIVPAECWNLLEYRRKEFKTWPNSPISKLRNRQQYLAEALEIVRSDGPVTAHQLPPAVEPRRQAGDWHKSTPRSALEYHFGRGQVAVTDRLPNFQRRYDLPERVIPEVHLRRSYAKDEAQRELLRRAGRSLGVGTLQDLADYYRMSPSEARPRVAELVEDGALAAITIEGWAETAYLAAGARLPRRIKSRSLLSPFDPVIWFRPRVARLFNFHYRIEIYVPEKKRKWGYYVLPFLLNDQLAARVDLKADRQASCLLVQSAHLELGHDATYVATHLSEELDELCHWLGLDKIKVRLRGKFARELSAHTRIFR